MGRSRIRLVLATLLVPLAMVALGAEPPPQLVLQWRGDLNWPEDVAVDAAGNVYVSDNHGSAVHKFDSDGNFVRRWGSSGTGDGQFNRALGIAVDANGDVYVTELGDRVQKFDSDGTFLAKWGSHGHEAGQFTAPRGIAVDTAGNVYVTDDGNHRVQKFTGSGTFVTQWGSLGSGNGEFNGVRHIAVDTAGYVYVADAGNYRVQKFDSNGTYVAQWGSYGSGAGQFVWPYGIAVDAAGNVYVGDYNNHRVEKFAGDGTFLTQWHAFYPLGITPDADNNVYVVASHPLVLKFEPRVPPVFLQPTSPENGETFHSPAGKLLTLDIVVEDGNTGDTVTLEAIELPAGAVITPGLPVSGNPVEANFAWTPEDEDAGQHVVTLRATDGVGEKTEFTFTVNVTGDSDGDGLSDLWETEGYTAPNGAYVPLHQMGADPNHKDIFVDVDYMVGEANDYIFDHRPICAALDEIKATFAAAPVPNPDGTTGITLHVRVAQHADCSSSSVTPRVDFVESLGSKDAAGNYLWAAPPGSTVTHFDDLKGAPGIFPEELGYAVHYCVFAHGIAGGEGQTGISRGHDAGDFIVSLGAAMAGEAAHVGTPPGSTLTGNPEQQAGTFMHELGHNLDLGHGGADGLRQKPNYLSIMNKDYFQMTGLLIDGQFGLIGGDHGSGASRHYHFDYSREALPGWAGNVLDEANLDDSVGLQGSAAMTGYGTFYYALQKKWQVDNVNEPIEWDVFLNLSAPFSMDVSNLNGITLLAGHDDWSSLSYTGGQVGGGIIIALPVATPAPDELTADEAIEQVHTPATVVEKLKGHVAAKMLHLTWKPVGPGVTYRVYRWENGGTPAPIGTTTKTNFKDKNVVNGVIYTYTVTVVDPVHETESPFAEAVSLQLRK